MQIDFGIVEVGRKRVAQVNGISEWILPNSTLNHSIEGDIIAVFILFRKMFWLFNINHLQSWNISELVSINVCAFRQDFYQMQIACVWIYFEIKFLWKVDGEIDLLMQSAPLNFSSERPFLRWVLFFRLFLFGSILSFIHWVILQKWSCELSRWDGGVKIVYIESGNMPKLGTFVKGELYAEIVV